VTDGDIIMTDGVSVRSIGEARVKRYLFDTIDQTNYQNLFCVYNRPRGEVWICFPESGSTYATQALVYDVANDAFGIRDLPAATHAAIGIVDDTSPSQVWDDDSGFWDDDTETWNAVGLAHPDGQFFDEIGRRLFFRGRPEPIIGGVIAL
jgi:hypothetical protein